LWVRCAWLLNEATETLEATLEGFSHVPVLLFQQFPPMALLSYTTLASGQSAGDLTFIWL